MNRIIKVLVWVIWLVPVIYLAAVWNDLPERVPMKYNFDGEPIRYGTKMQMLTALGVVVLINIGVYFLLVNIYRIDPKKKYTKENAPRLRKLAFAVSVFLSAIACFIVYSSVATSPRINSRIIVIGVGLFFTVIGNYMYNIKPNYFTGIRLPWTLENEENWRKTHLLAGKLWFAGGLLVALTALLLPGKVGLICSFSIIAILTIIPVVYSYRLYKNQPH